MSTTDAISILRLKRNIGNQEISNIIVLSPVRAKYIPIHFLKPYPNEEAWDDILQITLSGIYELHIDDWDTHNPYYNPNRFMDLRYKILSALDDVNYGSIIQDIDFFNYARLMYIIGIAASKGEIEIVKNNNVPVKIKYGFNIWDYNQNGTMLLDPNNIPNYPVTLASYMAHFYHMVDGVYDTYFMSLTIPNDTTGFELISLVIDTIGGVNTLRHNIIANGEINNVNDLETMVLHIIFNYIQNRFFVTQPSLYKVNTYNKHMNNNIMPPTAYGYTTQIGLRNVTTNSYIELHNANSQRIDVFLDI